VYLDIVHSKPKHANMSTSAVNANRTFKVAKKKTYHCVSNSIQHFSKTFTFIYASPGNSVIAAVFALSGIRERNHGSSRSTRPITVHERTAICKSQLEPIIENPDNAGGGTSFWSLIRRRTAVWYRKTVKFVSGLSSQAIRQ